MRLARVMAFPLACTVHGVGGIAGAARLLAGARLRQVAGDRDIEGAV